MEKYTIIKTLNNGYSVVSRQEKTNTIYNLINKDGKILSSIWFDWFDEYHDGLALVISDGCKTNFIDEYGRLISSKWFYNIGFEDFKNGFAVACINNSQTYINKKGEFISKICFSKVYDFYDGCAMVLSNGKKNFINEHGKLLSSIWFDRVQRFRNGYARVYLNGIWKRINTEGIIV